MPLARRRRWLRRGLLLDGFVLANFAFLVVDVFLAHSVNRFRHWEEWIPVGFSLVAAVLLLPVLWWSSPRGLTFSRRVGLILGFGSIGIGLGGLVYHLDSQFFSQWTIHSLVYTAPFAAPLAYAGLGFLLLVNRLVPQRSDEWSQWVVFFALGGFFGNFVLALCDHAQNGFFHMTEWLPVVASAAAVGVLSVSLMEQSPAFTQVCIVVLAAQIGVGILGFGLHLAADINGLSSNVFENFVHGAPVFAPLLCVDMTVLAAIGFGGRLTDLTDRRLS